MRVLIQRVNHAAVTVDGETVGEIGPGMLVFLGVGEGDSEAVADKLIRKVTGLRIFADENGKTNLDIRQIAGEMLIISQFTLYANCRKGNRPSFTKAGDPETAEALYEYFADRIAGSGIPVARGVFGGDMKVELENDGPFTIWLDSEDLA